MTCLPPRSELKDILAQLWLPVTQLLRKNEPAHRQAGLSETSTQDEILKAMIEYPILIERPIVIHSGKASIGRPPEKVLKVL